MICRIWIQSDSTSFLDLPKSNLVSPSWTCSTQVWLTISRESNSVSQNLDSLNLTSTGHVSKYVYVFIFCTCWVFPNLFLTRFKFNSFASISACQFQVRWLWCRLLKKQLPKQKIKSIQQNFTNRVRNKYWWDKKKSSYDLQRNIWEYQRKI